MVGPRRYAVLAPGSLPGDFTLAELLDRWHLDHADSGPTEAEVQRRCSGGAERVQIQERLQMLDSRRSTALGY